MSNNVTWVILTDGYYIKIMYYQDLDINLNVYRDGDFESSSDITYSLITRYRNEGKKSEDDQDSITQIENPDYLFKLLGKFLTEKAKSSEFENLVFIGPTEIMDNLNVYLDAEIYQKITNRLSGDFLSLSQDILQARLKSLMSDKN